MLKELISHLKKLESETKRHQREDTDASVVRTLLYKLLEIYHEMEHSFGRSIESFTPHPTRQLIIKEVKSQKRFKKSVI